MNLVRSDLHPDTNPGRPDSGSGPKWARGQHDNLMLPNGSAVGQPDNETLRRRLARLGIADARTQPRNEIVEAYAAKDIAKRRWDGPLLPQYQTSIGVLLMSALCQKKTHALQQSTGALLPSWRACTRANAPAVNSESRLASRRAGIVANFAKLPTAITEPRRKNSG